ncbi:SurA N-terminal domain-containing protein [Candidatus Saccharibacteria bacterium]|nr:SurA N-terminal domain-containing protein [Candidatus Saccharibacteria bacterium]
MKLIKKIKLKKKSGAKAEAPKGVTQKNIEESREAVLAKGKKLKYPFQYEKHRLVITAAVIGVIALVTFGVVGWFQLYKAHNTNDVTYRFTKVLPLAVAKVDGVSVKFSDYLLLYRSSITAIERQQGELENLDDAEAQRNHYKRQALSDAEKYDYALAKLEEMGEKVSEEEIDAVIEGHQSVDGERRSDEAFSEIVKKNFGLSMKDYRRMLKLSLAQRKYSEKTDETARKLAAQVEQMIKENGGDLAAAADALADTGLVRFEATDRVVEVANLDSGRAEKASQLKNIGEVSERFLAKNGDGYYFVKLTSREGESVGYESILVQFTEFEKRFEEIIKDKKIEEYIEIKE